MKRLLYAGVLLVIAVILSVIEIVGVNKTIDDYIDKLESLKEPTISLQIDNCKKLSDEWKDDEKFLNMFLLHDTLDEIGNEFNTLEAYAKFGDEGEYNATIDKMKKQLLSLKESELLLLENIL